MTLQEILKLIAFETARMASPGSFYGRVISGEKTKIQVARYFTEQFPIANLWNQQAMPNYQNWHQDQITVFNNVITPHIHQLDNHEPRTPFAISAKFLDTFMHQLMKYERFRYLYNLLYLPLDNKALQSLSLERVNNVEVPEALRRLSTPCRDNPYSMEYTTYLNIQNNLPDLMNNINQVLPEDCKLKARIELNSVLWL